MPLSLPTHAVSADQSMKKTEKDSGKPRIVFLCGLKSCGKTTLAKEAALRGGCLSIDSDEEILKRNPQYKTCHEMFKAVGEKAFREEESLVVTSIAKQCKDSGKTAVVSLGGGACDANDVLETARANGIVIYLSQTEHVLFERLQTNGLPAYLDEKDARRQFHELYLKRNEKYSCFANYVVQLPNCTKEEAVEAICSALLGR